jgi:hypothetical protein
MTGLTAQEEACVRFNQSGWRFRDRYTGVVRVPLR